MNQINPRWAQAVGLVDEVAEGALQFQGFDGEGAGGSAETLISGKQSTLRSTVTADRLRRTEKWKSQGGGCGGQRLLLACPSACSSRPRLSLCAFRSPVSSVSLSAFQLFASCPGVGTRFGQSENLVVGSASNRAVMNSGQPC